MDDLVEENPRPPLDLVDIVLEDDRWEDAGLPAMAERAARAVGDWLELGEFQVQADQDSVLLRVFVP